VSPIKFPLQIPIQGGALDIGGIS